MEEYLKLKQLVEQVADDVFKAAGGNKAAGTRVRKAMQDIKNAAQTVRERVLSLRGSSEGGESAGEQPAAANQSADDEDRTSHST